MGGLIYMLRCYGREWRTDDRQELVQWAHSASDHYDEPARGYTRGHHDLTVFPGDWVFVSDVALRDMDKTHV